MESTVILLFPRWQLCILLFVQVIINFFDKGGCPNGDVRQISLGGRWEVGGGRWEVGGGRWEVGGGRWEVGGGRFTGALQPASQHVFENRK